MVDVSKSGCHHVLSSSNGKLLVVPLISECFCLRTALMFGMSNGLGEDVNAVAME
jgi:hypothetical protein